MIHLHIYIYIYIYIYTNIYIDNVACYIDNRKCSISLKEGIYLSEDGGEAESTFLGNSQFLAYAFIIDCCQVPLTLSTLSLLIYIYIYIYICICLCVCVCVCVCVCARARILAQKLKQHIAINSFALSRSSVNTTI